MTESFASSTMPGGSSISGTTVVRIVLGKDRDRAVAEAAAEFKAEIRFVDAQIVLVAPEPAWDRSCRSP